MFYIKTHTAIHNFKKLFTLLITNIGSNEPILSCTYMCVRKPFPCWLTLNIAYRRLRHRFFCRLPNLFFVRMQYVINNFRKIFLLSAKKKKEEKRILRLICFKIKRACSNHITDFFFYVLWTIVFNRTMLNSVAIFVRICAINRQSKTQASVNLNPFTMVIQISS